MPSSESHTVEVDGQDYDGWTDFEVDTTIDLMAGVFEITTTDRWPGQPERWPVQTGAKVRIFCDDELKLTGWVDQVQPTEQPDKHEIKIRGRGRTGDLVDCSALNKPGSWSRRKLEAIVADLCKPFGISVTVAAGADTGAPFASFALQQGESVKNAIDRLVQQRGLLPVETPTGDLVLSTPSAVRSSGSLTLGPAGNCWGEADHNASERFSQYIVKGQRKGSDDDWGAAVSQVTMTANDAGVTRYRPLMILAEDQADLATVKNRAQFAATVRAARSQGGDLTTPGDRDQTGALWTHNQVVPVDAADLGLQGDLLIRAVKLKVSSKGTLSVISVVRPEAYSLGEVKGASLSRLDNRHAARGQKARRGGGKGPGIGGLETQ